MAFINASTSKKIRNTLKELYPEIKWSVRIQDNMVLHVTIVESPYWKDGEILDVNHHWIEEHFSGIQKEVLLDVDKIIREVGEYFNDSDIMTDYFSVAFYYNIGVGVTKEDGHKYREYNLKLAL